MIASFNFQDIFFKNNPPRRFFSRKGYPRFPGHFGIAVFPIQRSATFFRNTFSVTLSQIKTSGTYFQNRTPETFLLIKVIRHVRGLPRHFCIFSKFRFPGHFLNRTHGTFLFVLKRVIHDFRDVLALQISNSSFPGHFSDIRFP